MFQPPVPAMDLHWQPSPQPAELIPDTTDPNGHIFVEVARIAAVPIAPACHPPQDSNQDQTLRQLENAAWLDRDALQ